MLYLCNCRNIFRNFAHIHGDTYLSHTKEYMKTDYGIYEDGLRDRLQLDLYYSSLS